MLHMMTIDDDERWFNTSNCWEHDAWAAVDGSIQSLATLTLL